MEGINSGTNATPLKHYTALLSQNAPIASKTFGDFSTMLGSLWTITTYNAGDDFSNMELISGVVNTSGAVIRAIGTGIPTVWANASDLAYSGAPYIVSKNKLGNFAPFENTLGGDIVWSYNSVGVYNGTLNNAFPLNKVLYFNGTFKKYFIGFNAFSVNAVKISTCDNLMVSKDDILISTSIEIIINK